jgi:hypothetical protein
MQCIYEKWGLSACTCLFISWQPGSKAEHKSAVIQAARYFVRDCDAFDLTVDTSRVSHILFSVQPDLKRQHTKERRQILIVICPVSS